MKVISMSEFHIPQPLMEIIVSTVGEDGVDALKNFLLAGREGRDAPPYQPNRVGRPRCRRCKKVGHRLSTCTE
ncbi:putative transcription factor interactor and regulator CCHC(Zn) family [Arabidopsis thaliana]